MLVVGGKTLAAAGSNATLTSASGTTLTLGSGNDVEGLTVTGVTGISGTSFGTLTVHGVSVNTTGQALNLSTGAFAVGSDFGAITSTGGTNGIALDSLTSTLDFASAVNVSGSSGYGISVTGTTTPTLNFNGAVTIDNHATTGGGVSIAKGTVGFTGGLVITTSSGTGFNETGGTIAVTGSGNTIAATTGSGLTLGSATVGASGVTFDSITSGGNMGIQLNGTQLTGAVNVGGLTATGDTGAYFSGITGAGGVNLTGTIDIDDTDYGLYLSGTLGTINIANTAGSVLTIDGGAMASMPAAYPAVPSTSLRARDRRASGRRPARRNMRSWQLRTPAAR